MIPKITVIMPNCNYAKYLPFALDSLLHQTFTDWECIIIDDGSRDNSCDIIREYMSRDSRFKLIETGHCGLASARNRGLDAASGEFIAFLDSDDCYTQTALETLYNHAVMTGADIVGGAVQNVFMDFRFVPTKNVGIAPCDHTGFSDPSVYFLNCGEPGTWFWMWRRLFRRSFIGDARFNEQMNIIGEDIYFMLENAWRANKIVDIRIPVVYHRRHSASASMRAHPTDIFRYLTNILNLANQINVNYSHYFCKALYNSICDYLLKDALIKPRMYKTFQAEGRQTLISCAKIIPLKYLSGRRRFLFWYLSKLKNA